jgi:hypothetical protein
MVRIILVCGALLTAQAAEPPGPEETGKTAPKDVDGDKSARALATYNRMREKTPETAAAQWKLALWCEQNGLPAEAFAHLASVVKLDPKREAAWRKLGFKKVDGRWMTDEQIAEDRQLKKDEAVWLPRLKKLHKDIHGANGAKKQEEAQAALDAIADPAAISAVYREFAAGGELDQTIAVQIFGQIDKPVSSKVLALMAVYGKTPEVRRQANETLRRRNDEDYLGLLVDLLSDPLKYEVKAVGGPGSPGVLFVEGEKFNVRRFYAAPPPPDITPQPGDIVSYDRFGMPVVTRPLFPTGEKTGVPGSKTLAYERVFAAQFSATQNMLEARQAAATSQAQLEVDVAQVDAINVDRKKFNELVMAVMKAATGKDRGRTPKEWRDSLALENKYGRQPSRTPDKPTFDQLAPLGYNPTFAQLGFTTNVVNLIEDS